ncbi:MAG TPA: hypothetical protein VGE74_33125, partial [Gemmata sp.]
DLGAITDMCTSVVWMQHGRIVAQGPPQEIVDRYVAAASNPVHATPAPEPVPEPAPAPAPELQPV